MPKRDEALTAFGRNVAKFRTQRGLSQDKLAEEASLNRTYLNGIERGVRNPGIKVVLRPIEFVADMPQTKTHLWE